MSTIASARPNDPPDAVTLPRVEGRVEFRHVSFGYDPARLVLHDVNFVAAPGQTVALVGHTGGGKTSILNLIARFYEATCGRVMVEGTDVRELHLDDLRRRGLAIIYD